MSRHRMLSPALAIGLLCLAASGCGKPEPVRAPLVALIGIDGASPEIVDELRSKGRLPNLDALIRTGVYGPIESLPARRIMAANPRRGYWSPILWASIATGVVPEKHGIQDFLLPIPGTSRVWMGSEDPEPYAEMTLPAIEGEGPFLIRMGLRSHTPNGPQTLELVWNGEPLASVEVPVDWTELEVSLDAKRLRPVRNTLRFELERQSRPSDTEGSNDRRLLAAEMRSFVIEDAKAHVVFELEPVFARFELGRGFYRPEAKVVEAQSAHLRARPLWSLLGDAGHSVGVVGYWTTWPAYPVNGFLVSSRMGLRGRRENTKTDLTWPPELASELEPLYPSFDAMTPLFDELHLTRCDPPLVEDKGALPGVLRQDQLYTRAAEKLFPILPKDGGFATLYLESIDVLSHAYLGWKNGAPVREGCDPSTRDIVELTYELVDRWLGSVLGKLPEDAIVLVVSDHGLVPAELGGLHSPEGIFIASGGGPQSELRRGATFRGASVLDVAPTVMHLMREPIPTWMDGKLLAALFDPNALTARPPRYRDEPMTFHPETTVSAEGDEDVLERLRSIGYIQ